MSGRPKIAFIGAGSTVFMKNIVGDVLQRSALKQCHVALMDIDAQRLDESKQIIAKLREQLAPEAGYSVHAELPAALDGADFVIVAFQIGGYDPCTVTDFEIPKQFGLRQTIGDTLGIGGIMRGLRTVPQLWKLCASMTEHCPDALLLQYVNPMAINTWAIAERFPQIRQVGLCHSIQYTSRELALDLQVPLEQIRYLCAGINHMAFFLKFEQVAADGSWRDLYPQLQAGYASGELPRPENQYNERCANRIRYEMMKRTGYFVTESSEHFAEYVPWFIKAGRNDLIERYGIPLDEYPKRCVEHAQQWQTELARCADTQQIEASSSVEYASDIINAQWSGVPAVIYGNVPNRGYLTSLPDRCAVEVPCLVDRNGVQPTAVGKLPPQLAAMMRTNINVQQLTVEALLTENREHIYHAAMLDPHTGAELDLDAIWELVDKLIEAHGDWLPDWCQRPS